MPEKTLGSLLRKKRHELVLTQRVLADRLGVTPSHIVALEAGKRTPSLPLLQGLANTLNLDAQQVFLLVRPAAARSSLKSGNDRKPKNSTWQKLAGNKALRARERISPAELRVLKEVSQLGRVSSERRLLLVLRSIRLAFQEDRNRW